jgi:hypothetical protein
MLSSSESIEAAERYQSNVSPPAVEIQADSLVFPGGTLLPLSARGGGIPGMAGRPWARLSFADFDQVGVPMLYSLALRRESPDILRSSLRARRTLFEGFLLALAEKTGRRPSQAEQLADQALDAAESELALGKHAFRTALLVGLFASNDQLEQAEAARRTLEASLRARGLVPQRLFYIPERALLHFQPGGELFPGLDEPVLLVDEVLPILPKPIRQVLPAVDAVWIGTHTRQGRDVYFSFSEGLDPNAPPPPHALTLILGEMGSGKTSLMRLILLQRLLQGRAVVTIDPEGENNRLAQAVGGKVIPMNAPEDRETCLLHPLQGDDPADLLLAARFLVAALAGETLLTPGTQAALHEAVRRRWERRPGAMSLAGLVEALGAVNAPEAATPAALLRPYARGGLWEGFFDRPQALLSPEFTPGTWLNFDLSSLREENRAIVHAVLSWFLYNVVTRGKHPLDIFIDEGWRLLRGGPFADLLDELGRRARKRGVGVMLVTHLPADLARHPTSLSLASTAFIGRLGPEEAFAFFHSLGVPESQARQNADLVAGLPARIFLAAPSGGRGSLFPVQVRIPASWLEMWQLMGAAR